MGGEPNLVSLSGLVERTFSTLRAVAAEGENSTSSSESSPPLLSGGLADTSCRSAGAHQKRQMGSENATISFPNA